MQAYWNNPENKNFIMTLMVKEHEGFPPVLTPESPPDSGALDYEERLGIPLPIALVAEWVWLGAPQAYAAADEFSALTFKHPYVIIKVTPAIQQSLH